MASRLLVLLVLAAAAPGRRSGAAPVAIRGLDPSKASKYSPGRGGQWSCLDGSRTVEFSAVNDDYCDCRDGSDEPGACSVAACVIMSLHMPCAPAAACETTAAARSCCRRCHPTATGSHGPCASRRTWRMRFLAGTSACAGTTFYCVNGDGVAPKRLDSSFVDDGVCGELLLPQACSRKRGLAACCPFGLCLMYR